jgi:lambda repressor-like predicted transcriptional regulator
MSATMDRALSLADRFVSEEIHFRKKKRPDAVAAVAADAGIAPGSLENLFKRRLKHVERITAALERLAVRRLEGKVEEFKREIAQIRESGRPHDPARLAHVEAALAEAEKLLAEW